MDKGRALQVVQLVEGAYTLDEDALAQLLLGELAETPVAVVSVAGAYRGGKSFLLNFLLRYLQADEEQRADGSWLGGPSNGGGSVGGFNWRGGTKRDTTGLLLWSQPHRVVLPTGESILVLLMDTQGSFDWSSSVRDCSLVFALSSLLSSVQIYNLARDVRADDLHHLQLFTEYGKLATEKGDSAAFQTLQILVRDWGFSYDYPYGFEGGKQLLEERIQLVKEVSELSELWKRVKASFHSVDCFLMAHPGLRALNLDFNGALTDLKDEFKQCLNDFAPAVLGGENLQPKSIGGKTMTGRDLFHYFKSYLDIFNSDTTPAPMTILQATVTASLLSCAEGARARYRRAMAERCGLDGATSCSRAALRDTHQRARDDALAAISEAKIIGDASQISAMLDKLRQELDDELPVFELMNLAKIKKGMAEAQAAYEESLKTVAPPDQLCLHPKDLEVLHHEALENALDRFSKTRSPFEGEDEELQELNEWINERYHDIVEWNKVNNNGAVSAAYDQYLTHTKVLTDVPCFAPAQLNKILEKARTLADEFFAGKRSRQTSHKDEYQARLSESLTESIERMHAINESNNQSAIVNAMATYDGLMTELCAPHAPCLHPQHFMQEDNAATAQAKDCFYRQRTFQNAQDDDDDDFDDDDVSDDDVDDDDVDDDAYRRELEMELGNRHSVYREMNNAKNKQAITNAMKTFNKTMETACRTHLLQPIVTIRAAIQFDENYQNAVRCTKEKFYESRRSSRIFYDEDEFMDQLETKMDARRAFYWDKLLTDSVVAGVFIGAGTIATAVGGVLGALFARG